MDIPPPSKAAQSSPLALGESGAISAPAVVHVGEETDPTKSMFIARWLARGTIMCLLSCLSWSFFPLDPLDPKLTDGLYFRFPLCPATTQKRLADIKEVQTSTKSALVDEPALKKADAPAEGAPNISQIWAVREMFINIAGVALILGIVVL